MADKDKKHPTADGKSSLNSAVTSDLPNTAPGGDGDVTVDLTKAKVPAAAVEQPEPAPAGELTEGQKAELEAQNNAFETRAADAGIGLVKTDGNDHRYVGVAPARDEKAETPSGMKIVPENSTFTPLADVPFHNSIRIKDPTSGEYYYPADGVTSWDQCEHNGNRLIPEKADKKAAKEREEARVASL